MAYASVADLALRCGARELEQLTDIGSPRLGAVDEAVAQQALDDASALIDGYLVGRYALPLLQVPAVLKVHCASMARYQLMRRTPDERAVADQEATLAYLAQVAQGKIGLLAPSAAPAVQGAGPVVFAPGTKVMGREVY